MLEQLPLVILIAYATAFTIVLFVLLGLSLHWVYCDAEARGKPGWLVALAVLLLKWPLSLLLWLAFRPEIAGPKESSHA